MTATTARRCEGKTCLTILNQYNKGPLCSPCEKAEREASLDASYRLARLEDEQTVTARILRELGESVPLTAAMLRQRLGVSDRVIRRTLWHLIRDSRVEHGGYLNGVRRYRLSVAEALRFGEAE